jgi:hypothetical protein
MHLGRKAWKKNCKRPAHQLGEPMTPDRFVDVFSSKDGFALSPLQVYYEVRAHIENIGEVTEYG